MNKYYLMYKLANFQGTVIRMRLKASIFCLFCFLEVHLWCMEVPRLEVEVELQLPACAAATATQDLSHICDLHHSSWQRRSLTPQARPGVKPASSWILVRFITAEPQQELL